MLQRIRPGVRLVCGVNPERQYWRRLLRAGAYALWPQWEPDGSICHCLTDPAMNGTYAGVTLADDLGPFGWKAPFYDGANGYTNLLTAALQAAFSGGEGSLLIWIKVANAGVWTDSTRRDAWFLFADGDNYVVSGRLVASNTWNDVYRAGAVSKLVQPGGRSDTDWVPIMQTWSKAADQYRLFWNGTQIGGTATGLGTWAGTPVVVSVGSTSGGSAVNPWHGWLGPIALWDSALSPGKVEDLSTP